MKFKDKLSLVPHKPGSYQMKDKNGNIIYVGKAKDLNKRLSSYFNRIHTGKTAKMVSLVEDFQYIVASSELEAFIIEINLIKEFIPKYNRQGYEIIRDAYSQDEVMQKEIYCPKCKCKDIIIQKGDGHKIYGADFIAIICNKCKKVYGFNDVKYKPNCPKEL